MALFIYTLVAMDNFALFVKGNGGRSLVIAQRNGWLCHTRTAPWNAAVDIRSEGKFADAKFAEETCLFTTY